MSQDDKPYLLKKSDIDAMEGLHKVHFMNPDAVRTNKSLGDHTGLTGIGVHLIEVAPGALSTEFHVHRLEDECVYILEGTATAEIGDEEFEIGPGDFLGYRKDGLPHAIRNTGATPLKALVVGERGGSDVGDYPRKNKRIYRLQGQPWDLVDIAGIQNPAAGKKV